MFRCFAAPDKDKVDRYPYVFKLVPEDEERRTYYISSPSKSEMEVCKPSYHMIRLKKNTCGS
jgi:hypothetical protein